MNTVKNYSVFYSVLLLDSTANDCFRNLQWIAVIFYIYFRQILCFLLCINVKVYDTLLKNIVKYRDFFNRQIRASNLPTKYCKFYTLLYFLTLNLNFFFFFTGNCILFT